MPDIVRNPGWNRKFKSDDKANKRLLTGADAAERDAYKREEAANRGAGVEAVEALVSHLIQSQSLLHRLHEHFFFNGPALLLLRPQPALQLPRLVQMKKEEMRARKKR